MKFVKSAIVVLSLAALLLANSCRSKDPSREQEPTATSQPTPSKQVPEETAPAPAHAAPSEPQPANDVTKGDMRTIDGPSLKAAIRASGAKATLVNAWASWCGPCRREFPMLVSLRESLTAQKVDLLFVSVDDEESHQAAIDFGTSHGLKPPFLVAARPLSEFKAAMSPQWPGMLPATFLFDAQGELRYFWPGEVYESELTPIIEGFLAGKDIDGFARVGLQRGTDSRE